jgi:hypothetical protein
MRVITDQVRARTETMKRVRTVAGVMRLKWEKPLTNQDWVV